MKRKINNKSGFTLIELIVVISIMAILTTVSISNFRAAEKRKRVTLAIDGIIVALNQAQNYALTGKNTNNAQANCRTAQYFYVEIFYTNPRYQVLALNNCGTTDVMENYDIPPRVVIRPSGLVMGNTTATSKIKLAFYPPFGKLTGGVDAAAYNTFTTATITAASSDDSVTKTISIDGIIGRITR